MWVGCVLWRLFKYHKAKHVLLHPKAQCHSTQNIYIWKKSDGEEITPKPVPHVPYNMFIIYDIGINWCTVHPIYIMPHTFHNLIKKMKNTFIWLSNPSLPLFLSRVWSIDILLYTEYGVLFTWFYLTCLGSPFEEDIRFSRKWNVYLLSYL